MITIQTETEGYAMSEETKDLQMQEGKATTYVCSGQVCQRPTTDAKEMMERLG